MHISNCHIFFRSFGDIIQEMLSLKLEENRAGKVYMQVGDDSLCVLVSELDVSMWVLVGKVQGLSISSCS